MITQACEEHCQKVKPASFDFLSKHGTGSGFLSGWGHFLLAISQTEEDDFFSELLLTNHFYTLLSLIINEQKPMATVNNFDTAKQ